MAAGAPLGRGEASARTYPPIGLLGHGLEDLPETERVTTAYDVLAGWSHPSGRVVVVKTGRAPSRPPAWRRRPWTAGAR